MMKTIEESVVTAMDGTDTGIYPFLPYILQDFWEIGTSPDEVVTLLERHTSNHARLKVLDLGCGKGAVSIRLAEVFQCHCLGIDAIGQFVSEANRKAEVLHVGSFCEFKVADIREEIGYLGEYDVIVLGAIGQVYGDYRETLAAVLPRLKSGGVVIIDDAYVENQGSVSHSSVLEKGEMLRQIEQAGMVLVDEIRAEEEKGEEYDEEFQLLVRRCHELMSKYPEKSSMFQDYIDNQRKEYTVMETEIVCSIMLLKRNQ